MIVLTDKQKEFPKVNGKLYEPEGIAWIVKPAYANPESDYWKRVHSKCKLLSVDSSLSND